MGIISIANVRGSGKLVDVLQRKSRVGVRENLLIGVEHRAHLCRWRTGNLAGSRQISVPDR